MISGGSFSRLKLSRSFGINDPYEVGDVSFVFKQLGVAPLLISVVTGTLGGAT